MRRPKAQNSWFGCARNESPNTNAALLRGEHFCVAKQNKRPCSLPNKRPRSLTKKRPCSLPNKWPCSLPNKRPCSLPNSTWLFVSIRHLLVKLEIQITDFTLELSLSFVKRSLHLYSNPLFYMQNHAFFQFIEEGWRQKQRQRQRSSRLFGGKIEKEERKGWIQPFLPNRTRQNS